MVGKSCINFVKCHVPQPKLLTVLWWAGQTRSVGEIRLPDNEASKLMTDYPRHPRFHLRVRKPDQALVIASGTAKYTFDVLAQKRKRRIVNSTTLSVAKAAAGDSLEAKKFRTMETMNELGILGVKDSRIGDSGMRISGEKRRVSIACELVMSPSILFLDEPTSGLDAYNLFNVVESLATLARDCHRTVVFMIHQPRSNIVALFDQLVLLAQGKLVLFDILPLWLVPPLMFGRIVYGLVRLVPTVAAFCKFILTLILFNLTTPSVVLLFSIAFSGISIASLVGTLAMRFKCLALYGSLINRETVVPVFQWLHTISFFHAAFEALTVNELRYLQLKQVKYGVELDVPAATILSIFGLRVEILLQTISALSLTLCFSPNDLLLNTPSPRGAQAQRYGSHCPFIPSTMLAAGAESKALLQRLITGTLRPSEHKQPSQNVVAVDCQTIRVRDGEQYTLGLARVSIVDFNGVVLLDIFVSPTLPVVDYRTRVHEIRKHDLDNGQPFVDVKQLVEELFRGALVVGHSLEHHLDALAIKHPSQQLRDTAVLGARVQSGWTPSLKKLFASELQVTIQNDKRSSVEDARAAMAIYRMYQRDWNEPLCLSDAFNPVTRMISLFSKLGQSRAGTTVV
ncbi:hypothetical protein PILCRDRAFT_10074 [Piloderma croceum F 1598]|uniref:ABC transporter domain-containing protein n=1 Tax=Piloderma croceum (strain F 1598) TaxID=765440 RepID=A0A0C3BRE6_PILCF|nr:hypothetical protein PILCRDRAFT_10074 [Piloderma croceum F 1598]